MIPNAFRSGVMFNCRLIWILRGREGGPLECLDPKSDSVYFSMSDIIKHGTIAEKKNNVRYSHLTHILTHCKKKQKKTPRPSVPLEK